MGGDGVGGGEEGEEVVLFLDRERRRSTKKSYFGEKHESRELQAAADMRQGIDRMMTFTCEYHLKRETFKQSTTTNILKNRYIYFVYLFLY